MKIKTWMVVAVAAFLFFALWMYFSRATTQPDANEQVAVVAEQSKLIKHAPKIEVIPKKPVKVYKSTPALKNGLKLPKHVVENEKEFVVTSVETPKDDHAYTVTTTINEDTGQTETYIKKEPLPTLAMDYRGSIGLYAGIKNGEQAVRLQARQDLFDIKSVRVGAVATLDQTQSGQQDYFVGIGVSYHW